MVTATGELGPEYVMHQNDAKFSLWSARPSYRGLFTEGVLAKEASVANFNEN